MGKWDSGKTFVTAQYMYTHQLWEVPSRAYDVCACARAGGLKGIAFHAAPPLSARGDCSLVWCRSRFELLDVVGDVEAPKALASPPALSRPEPDYDFHFACGNGHCLW